MKKLLIKIANKIVNKYGIHYIDLNSKIMIMNTIVQATSMSSESDIKGNYKFIIECDNYNHFYRK